MTIYSCRVRGLYAGAYRWSYGIHCNATVSATSLLSTWHDANSTLWTTATHGYQHLVSTEVTTVDVAVYTLNASLVTLAINKTPLAITGDNANASLPFATSTTVNFYGNSDIKSDRGRMKLPAPSEDNLVAHVWSTAFLTSMKDILDPFTATLDAISGFQSGSWNRRTNRQGDPPFTFHPFTAYAVTNKPGTNRNRTKKILPSASVAGSI
jgi:hypothetical protein